MNYLLLFLLFIFSYLSNINVNFYGELSFLELFQATILVTCFFIHLSCKRLFLKLSNPFTFIVRLFLYLFLFYEEISFLSTNSNPFFQAINFQSEVNIHNLNIFNIVLFRIPFPFTNHISSLELWMVVYSICFFILGFGSFLPYLKRFKYLFLERKYAIFSFVFFLNLTLSAFIRHWYKSSFVIFPNSEFLELFVYILLLCDVLQKKKIMKQKIE